MVGLMPPRPPQAPAPRAPRPEARLQLGSVARALLLLVLAAGAPAMAEEKPEAALLKTIHRQLPAGWRRATAAEAELIREMLGKTPPILGAFVPTQTQPHQPPRGLVAVMSEGKPRSTLAVERGKLPANFTGDCAEGQAPAGSRVKGWVDERARAIFCAFFGPGATTHGQRGVVALLPEAEPQLVLMGLPVGEMPGEHVDELPEAFARIGRVLAARRGPGGNKVAPVAPRPEALERTSPARWSKQGWGAPGGGCGPATWRPD